MNKDLKDCIRKIDTSEKLSVYLVADNAARLQDFREQLFNFMEWQHPSDYELTCTIDKVVLTNLETESMLTIIVPQETPSSIRGHRADYIVYDDYIELSPDYLAEAEKTISLFMKGEDK